MRALIVGLPADSATARHYQQRPAPVAARVTKPRTSSPEAIRRAGGKFVYAPRGGD